MEVGIGNVINLDGLEVLDMEMENQYIHINKENTKLGNIIEKHSGNENIKRS